MAGTLGPAAIFGAIAERISREKPLLPKTCYEPVVQRQRQLSPPAGHSKSPYNTLGKRMARIRLGKKRIDLPGSKIVRIGLGVVLVIAGILGFLPVLGFWMVPVGLVVLSVDLPSVRRQRRRLEVWWNRRRRGDRPNNKKSR